MQKLTWSTLLAVPSIVAVEPVYAYIGPGAGAGTIAVVLGILATIAMAFFGLLWYPIKRVVTNRSRNTNSGAQGKPGTSNVGDHQ